jgi:hypothetical protein
MSKAATRDAKDSATSRVAPSGVIAMPFGKATVSATIRGASSASTTATMPRLEPSSKFMPSAPIMSKLMPLT